MFTPNDFPLTQVPVSPPAAPPFLPHVEESGLGDHAVEYYMRVQDRLLVLEEDIRNSPDPAKEMALYQISWDFLEAKSREYAQRIPIPRPQISPELHERLRECTRMIERQQRNLQHQYQLEMELIRHHRATYAPPPLLRDPTPPSVPAPQIPVAPPPPPPVLVSVGSSTSIKSLVKEKEKKK